MKKFRRWINKFRLPALILAVPLMVLGVGGCSPGAKSPVESGAELANNVGLARASAYLVLQAASDTLHAVTSRVTTREEAMAISVAEDLSYNSLREAHAALRLADSYMESGNVESAKNYVRLALTHSESVFTLIGREPSKEIQDAIGFLKGYLGVK